ncbi:helix-turn-helix domain-containing protein [Hymenobacter piscis]|uniref:helix-turn-helix domain-containing protein n=1 Tax=Hymenobacter piscis TaxID=2839984 RepID=UPI001FEBD870|nr:transposase [Hymenobacter piscis]
MQPYSLDLRTRVAAACREPNARKTQVAQRFGVSRSFVGDLLRRERETGSLAPKPASGGPERRLSADDQAWLVAYVGQHADATLAELNQAWQTHSGRSVGQTCLWNVLNEQDLRRKKKASTPPSVIRPA